MNRPWVTYLEITLAGLGLCAAAIAYLLSLAALEFCAILLAAIAFGMLISQRLSD